jgi:hypothetical protein
MSGATHGFMWTWNAHAIHVESAAIYHHTETTHMSKNSKTAKGTKSKKPKMAPVSIWPNSAAKAPDAASTPAPAEDAPKEKKRAKAGKMSGLDAVVKVLAEAGAPMNTQTMVETAAAKGYWSSSGKTPAATIYAAIIREITKKGAAARFKKVERGMFTIA